MGVIALVMAGGKGTRMGTGEKPLLKVGDKPMIERVLDALMGAEGIEEIAVAVSGHTPGVAKFVEKFPIKVLKTPGSGYVSDMRYAIKRLKPSAVLTISADLPLVTGEVIEEVIRRYELCEKPALAVAVPAEARRRLGLGADHAFEVGDRLLVPAGINILDGGRIDEPKLEEEVLVTERWEIAVNVNEPEDLKIAESLLNHADEGAGHE